MDQLPDNTIVFDNYCNLCSWSVHFIIKRDKQKVFWFTDPENEAFKEFLKEKQMHVEPGESVMLIRNGNLYKGSAAALRISKQLGGLWPVMYIFIIIPAPIREGVYKFIAKNRYKWFGERKNAFSPEPDAADRFF